MFSLLGFTSVNSDSTVDWLADDMLTTILCRGETQKFLIKYASFEM